MDDRQLSAIPESLERCQTGIEPEEAVEIDRAIFGARRADGNRRTRACVLVIAERDDEAEAVDSASLEACNARLTQLRDQASLLDD